MMTTGLESEVQNLYPFKDLKALQTVGYRELFDHFNGLSTLEKAVDMIKQNTRRYAKRQITWWNHHGEWKKFKYDDINSILQYIHNELAK